MEFTQGRRDNRYYPEDEDEERDDCIAEGDGGGCGRGGVGGLHPFLTVSSSPSPSSSSGAIVVDWTDQTGASTSATAPPAPAAVVEKEHMFEKIVTPSDVGKLNRLVIPKQHAEKYFPLDSSTHEKGLLLNFEDRNGKPWRFRYSYWNSSQSYVMTKGWSRFVKEKRLDAGDTVSFGRGVGEDARDRLFIDWKRRPDPHLDPPASLRIPRFSYNSASPSSSSSSFHHPYLSFSRSTAAPWAAGRLFFPQTPPPVAPSTNYFYIRSGSAAALPQPDRCPPVTSMVLDSVPVAHGKSTTPKRVRLFGVNLDQPRNKADVIPENVVDRSGKLQLQTQASIPELRLGSAESSAASSSSSSSRGGKDMC